MSKPAAPVQYVSARDRDEASEARVARYVREFDALGCHRSGTKVERLTCEWLAGEAAKHGVRCQLRPYSFERVEPVAGWLEVDGRRIDGLPLFDAAFTDGEGVTGRLGDLESEAAVRVAFVEAGHGSGGARVPRPAGRAVGMVVVTMGDRAGLCPKNAHAYEQPFGPPTLQVSSVHAGELAAWARQGRNARLVASAVRIPASGWNVIARIAGVVGSRAPVVVMTPLTGWWHCAAERGGGLACWLEAIRGLAGSRPARPAVFIATGGHELGDLGLRRLLAEEPYLERDAFAWVRLGADIGAASPGGILLTSPDEGLIEAAQAELQHAGLSAIVRSSQGSTVRQLLIRGENEFFHHPDDRWPASVDAGSLSRQATAYAALISSLAGAVGAS
ncbi:MAG TPA: hypothetical protein VNN10_04620 [Dehalococcoidia bacterium]|nr:hypothetical protein [Dehalococcoidia bacterium]